MNGTLRTGVALLALANTLPAAAAPASATDNRLSRLEAQVRAQAGMIAEQRHLIDEQRAALERLRADTRVPASLAGTPQDATAILRAGGGASTGPTPSEGAQTVATATGPAGAAPSAGTDAIGTQVARAVGAANALAQADLERPRAAVIGGRPSLTTADGRFTVAVRAIVQGDVGGYFQRAAGPLTTDFRRGSVGGGRENVGAGQLSNGQNFRRARIGIEGTFDRDWGYRFVGEFGGSGTEGPARINDAWISYTGFAPFTVQVGAFAPPANMDDGQSPEDQIFLERASSAELSRALAGADGRAAVSVRGNGTRWFGAVSATGPTVNDAEALGEQLGVVGRAAYLVASDQAAGKYNVQIGASGTYVFNTADQGFGANPRFPFRLRDRPELRLDSTRLIDTGAIDGSSAYAVGCEAGAQVRQFYLQGEYFTYGIGRRNTAVSDPAFDGGYIEGSWVLTGEYRRQNMATASFQNPRPRANFNPRTGGWGAFELAARYSWLDLNYQKGRFQTPAAANSVRGGSQKIVTMGLNWYPTSNLKFLFNWLHVDVDRLNPAGPGNLTPFGAAPGTPPIGAELGQSYDAVALRSQFAF